MINALLILLVLISLTTKEVKAYLDPGSGSYLLQILFASFFSALLIIKTFWKKIVIFVKQIFGSRNEKAE